MERSLQIKRRDEIIRDIESKDFQLNMGWYAKDFNGNGVRADKVADRELCNTPMCIAGDATRRLAIVAPSEFQTILEHHWCAADFADKYPTSDVYFACACQYLNLTRRDATLLFCTEQWPEPQKYRYLTGDMAEKKKAAIEMLRMVIPDMVSVEGVAK